jgi:predicted anti-sigma-YlaC factor YlaD
MNEASKSAACLALEQDLVLLHYGELGGLERRRVEAHLQDCPGCRRSLAQLSDLLPQTILADEPPPAFWNDYSRELHQKLAQAGERQPWWRKLFVTFQPWALPAFATAALVALALTFTLGEGLWQQPETPPVEDAILEVLPIAENLDLLDNLDVLDHLELLEQMRDQGAA